MSTASWDDPSWQERSDTPWRRRLRRHQGWWREHHTDGLAAGAGPRGDRPVVSMLPVEVGFRPNLLTQEAVEAAEKTIARLAAGAGPGLIDQRRLRRNLLSSQPLCFNLFGHLQQTPEALLPWVRSIDQEAVRVTAVELEIAPTEKPVGASAFDAFVVYARPEGSGFLGIECKYAEDLKATLRKAAGQKYREATTEPTWRSGAVAEVDRTGLRQFWFNTLLAQRVLGTTQHSVGHSVVVACRADEPARTATSAVAAQLGDPSFLQFSAIEDIVEAVAGHEQWKASFRTRYLDLELSGS